MAAHHVIGFFAAHDGFYRFIFGFIPAASYFKRGNNRNCFGFAYAPKIAKLINGCFCQLVQVVIIMMQDAFA